MAPLLLLPGLSNTPEIWDDVRAQLPVGIVCHALENAALEDIDAIAGEILASAPPRFALAGFSFGGYVSLAIAAKAMDRIERIALIATGANADSPEASASRKRLIEIAEKDYPSVDTRMTKFLLHPDRVEDHAIHEIRSRMSRDYGAACFIAQQRAAMTRPARDAVLASIRVPTLIAVGREDKVTPLAQHEEMARRVPAADLVVFEHCGHLAPLEAPRELAQAPTKWMTH